MWFFETSFWAFESSIVKDMLTYIADINGCPAFDAITGGGHQPLFEAVMYGYFLFQNKYGYEFVDSLEAAHQFFPGYYTDKLHGYGFTMEYLYYDIDVDNLQGQYASYLSVNSLPVAKFGGAGKTLDRSIIDNTAQNSSVFIATI